MAEITGPSPEGTPRLRRQLSECYRTMETLRKSEERFRLLVERARDVVYRFSFARQEFEYVSPMVLVTTGYAPSELYDLPALVMEIVHPDDRAVVEDYWKEGDWGRPLAFRCVHRDGDVVWVEHRSLPIFDDGELVAVEGIIRDVSENVRLLRESEVHNETLGSEVARRRRVEKTLRGFSARLVTYQEEERQKVARELHDGVSQWLCGVGFRVESVLMDLESGSPPRNSLMETKLLVDRCIDDIRRISQSPRPGALDDIGLVPAIRSLLVEFEERTGLTVTARLPEHRGLSSELDTTVFRLLQETMDAVGAKRGVSTIELVLGCDDSRLKMSFADDGEADGNGSGPQWGPQIILESLQERAGFAGGTVTTKATALGTHLEMQFPIPSEETPDD